MFLYLIGAFTHTDVVGSNLTFGAGGKDKDGNNVIPNESDIHILQPDNLC